VPFLSALEVVTTMRYTNRRSLYFTLLYRYRRSDVVSLSVGLLVTFVSPAKNGWTDRDAVMGSSRVGPKNHVLYGDAYPQVKGVILGAARQIQKHWQSLLLSWLQKGSFN